MAFIRDSGKNTRCLTTSSPESRRRIRAMEGADGPRRIAAEGLAPRAARTAPLARRLRSQCQEETDAASLWRTTHSRPMLTLYHADQQSMGRGAVNAEAAKVLASPPSSTSCSADRGCSHRRANAGHTNFTGSAPSLSSGGMRGGSAAAWGEVWPDEINPVGTCLRRRPGLWQRPAPPRVDRGLG